MSDLKSTTIYSQLPFHTSKKDEASSEEIKISYWLKKLFDQQEKKITENKDIEEFTAGKLQTRVGNDIIIPNRIIDSKKSEKLNIEQPVHSKARDNQLTEIMVKKSNREVLSISTLFPWSFFPTTIRIQENKVSFIYHQLLSSQEEDVDIKDISNTHIDHGFFYSKLKFISNTFANEPVIIDHLRKNDAVHARMIIQGLQLFSQKNIDTSNYDITDLIKKLDELQKDKYNDSRNNPAHI